MPLRGSNNPNTDTVILGVLKNILPANTQLAAGSQSGTGVEQIYVQNKYLMSLGNFPAIHLEAGGQHYRRNSRSTYMGGLEVIVEYYDRWDTQASTIDTIRANIALDLERAKSNVESNDSLAYGGQAYAISIPEVSLSPYKGEIDTQFPGMTLVYRAMHLMINILPYDC